MRSCRATASRPVLDLDAVVRTVPDFPQPGIQFKDLTPLLADPAALAEALDRLAAPWADAGVTHVVGIESRGFWLGASLALRLGAGFVPARKPGKLPAPGPRETYALEYGEDAIELPEGVLPAGARALVHDDVIATGGTAGAACRLVERSGATVAGCSFLLELSFLDGRRALPEGTPVHALMTD